jgi:DNA-binding protein H-NS
MKPEAKIGFTFEFAQGTQRPLSEIAMPKVNLASMSVDALLKLRDDVCVALNRRAKELEGQLSRLGHESRRAGRGSTLKGRKVAIKYRDRSGNTWAGRGAQPIWLREKLKAGAKLDDFAVEKTIASRKVSAKKTKRRRKKQSAVLGRRAAPSFAR